MPVTNVKRLSNILDNLRAERLEHLKAVDRIDTVFTDLGISPERQNGRVPVRKMGRRRRKTRRRFKVSGTKSILNFVKKAGRSGASSAQISKQWKSEGRSGAPYVTLGQLVRSRKLKKKSLKGRRGSTYTV